MRTRKSFYHNHEWRCRPGDASVALISIDQLIQGDRIYLLGRRSRVQKKGSADEQLVYYRARAHELGLVVVGAEAETRSGYDPWQLVPLMEKARKANATLLAATPNRFVRSRHFKSNDGRNHNRQATEGQWEEVAWLKDGLRMATFIHPRATPKEERAEHQRRSKAMKRPYADRTQLKPVAIDLKLAGWSNYQIGEYIDKNESTIRRWLSSK